MEVLAAESGRGKAVLGSTHDLGGVAEHFARMLALNGALVADGPAALIRHPGVLRATYAATAVSSTGLVFVGALSVLVVGSVVVTYGELIFWYVIWSATRSKG
jgi:hypothetical protein